MAALLSALGFFAFAWLLHLLWWRLRLPDNHTGALLLLFAAAPPLAAVLWAAARVPLPIGFSDVPGVTLLYLGAVGCYLIAYTAIEETSPSLAVFVALQAAGGAGCTREELSTVVTDSNFIKPRLDALRRDGILEVSGGGCVLSSRGKKAAGLAVAIARAFNIGRNA